MTNEQMQNEIRYHLSKNVLDLLLEMKLITEEQYRDIDILNRESFKPLLKDLMP